MKKIQNSRLVVNHQDFTNFLPIKTIFFCGVLKATTANLPNTDSDWLKDFVKIQNSVLEVLEIMSKYVFISEYLF